MSLETKISSTAHPRHSGNISLKHCIFGSSKEFKHSEKINTEGKCYFYPLKSIQDISTPCGGSDKDWFLALLRHLLAKLQNIFFNQMLHPFCPSPCVYWIPNRAFYFIKIKAQTFVRLCVFAPDYLSSSVLPFLINSLSVSNVGVTDLVSNYSNFSEHRNHLASLSKIIRSHPKPTEPAWSANVSFSEVPPVDFHNQANVRNNEV